MMSFEMALKMLEFKHMMMKATEKNTTFSWQKQHFSMYQRASYLLHCSLTDTLYQWYHWCHWLYQWCHWLPILFKGRWSSMVSMAKSPMVPLAEPQTQPFTDRCFTSITFSEEPILISQPFFMYIKSCKYTNIFEHWTSYDKRAQTVNLSTSMKPHQICYIQQQ